MKKFLIVAAALVAFAVPSVSRAHAGAYVAYEWVDSVTTTSGVALSSPVIDARDLESLIFEAEAATSTRSLVISCMAVDGTTSLFDFAAVTITAGSKFSVQMRPDLTVPASAPTGTTYLSVSPCPKVKASMAAVNGTAKLTVQGRRQQVAARVIKACPTADRTQPACYESGSVTAGAALTTGVIDTRRGEALQVLVEATTTNRALVVSCTDSAGTILYSYPSLTVTAGSKYLQTYNPETKVPGSEPTGVTHVPVELCSYMKADVAATGAASAKLAAYLR